METNPIRAHIDHAIQVGTLRNYNDLAQRLHVERGTVSKWISGRTAPSPNEARAIAEIIGMPEEVLMAESEALRAKDAATRAAWLRVARLCSRSQETATTLALLAIATVTLLMTAPTNAEANQRIASPQRDALNIIVTRGRRIWNWLHSAAIAAMTPHCEDWQAIA
jgi:transcriptional regulator with XRE-family HTH domain